MANTIIVDQGQSLLDVAVQHCGSVMAIVDLCLLNNVSVTDDLIPGTELLIPEVADPRIVAYLQDNNYIPATAEVGTGTTPEGIGVWIIGLDFKVS